MRTAGRRPVAESIGPDFDWNRPNEEIAEELGVAKDYVSTLRAAMRAPPAPRTRSRPTGHIDWSKDDGVIAEEEGVARGTIQVLRFRRGVPKTRGHLSAATALLRRVLAFAENEPDPTLADDIRDFLDIWKSR